MLVKKRRSASTAKSDKGAEGAPVAEKIRRKASAPAQTLNEPARKAAYKKTSLGEAKGSTGLKSRAARRKGIPVFAFVLGFDGKMSRQNGRASTELPFDVKMLFLAEPSSKNSTSGAPGHLIELAAIVERISDWAGGPRQALAWCQESAIPALGGFTAAELVASGQSQSVLAFLDHIAVGGFA